MKFRLLIETHAYTTIRELHVERLTGPLTDLKRDHVDVLELTPVAEPELPLVGPKTAGEPGPPLVTRDVRVEVGRSSFKESNLKPSGHKSSEKRPDALKDQVS